ncbi:hypothetical protein KIW84_044176 [Lathyrus oleraceus]|uniref:DUF7745 domain-containing protein n=1 Tax=Pisum sativum TaxID=3888 RepID=A0A9D5AV39_PEA|nr:hypothetical protein KIW84_044176 [Pisum sativum]
MGSRIKNTLPLKLKLPRMDTLVTLSSKITPRKKNNFICRYGRIQDFLTIPVDVLALVASSQYYDPLLRCFTFRDIRLTLTIEEHDRSSTEKEGGDNHCWFELVTREKKALRDEFDLEIQNLELSLCEANAKVEVERHLKEEAIRVSYITPQV